MSLGYFLQEQFDVPPFAAPEGFLTNCVNGEMEDAAFWTSLEDALSPTAAVTPLLETLIPAGGGLYVVNVGAHGLGLSAVCAPT